MESDNISTTPFYTLDAIDDEIFASTFFEKMGYMSGLNYKIKVAINGSNVEEFLFREIPTLEMAKDNKRNNGIFLQSNKNDFSVSESTPVIVKINEFAPSSIDLLVRCFTKTNDYNNFVETKDRLAIEIKKIVERRKGSFAFPSQSLYIEK